MADLALAVENAVRTLFRRCVQCPDLAPSCPVCPSGQVCSQTVVTCTACPSTTCVKSSLSGATTTNQTSGSNNRPNAGAIAGGVVGGVVFIAVATYLIWRFCIRQRRQADELTDEDNVNEKTNDDFTMRRDARTSTHTVTSMASTVLTRASNIIQIAYIPGVTNRSGAASPGFVVPPVPPIPIPTAPPQHPTTVPYTDNPEQHFFVPGDLRGSTYSGLSSTTDGRSSYAHRQSLTPSLARTSMASTVYRNNAVLDPMPAQTVVRGKAAVVSVKSSLAGSPAETPGVETPSPRRSLSTRRVGVGAAARPVPVRVASESAGVGQSPVGSVRSAATVGRPVPLNIVRKGKGATLAATPTQDSSRPQTATATAAREEGEGEGEGERPAHVQAQGLALVLRPLTEVSLAGSLDTNATHARARRSGAGKPRPRSDSSDADDDDEDDDEDDEDGARHSRSRRSLLASSERARARNSALLSPFTDGSASASGSGVSSPELGAGAGAGAEPGRASAQPAGGALATVIEEATRRARRESLHGGLGSAARGSGRGRERASGEGKRESGPFGEKYAL